MLDCKLLPAKYLGKYYIHAELTALYAHMLMVANALQ
jgi:hypothetical protein